MAVASGLSTNLTILAQTGSAAPGTTGDFTAFNVDDQSMVLAPDGNVAFEASAGAGYGCGLWFGKAGARVTARATRLGRMNASGCDAPSVATFSLEKISSACLRQAGAHMH